MVAGRGSGLRVAVMNRLGQLFILSALMGFPPAAQAHESRPAYSSSRSESNSDGLLIADVLSCIALVRRIPLHVPHWVELNPPYAIGSVAMFWVVQRVAAF